MRPHPKQIMLQNQTIHFCRWSRKNYAIFVGLGKHIVIGVLSVSICILSQLKGGTLIVCQSTEQNNILSSEAEPNQTDESLAELLCLVVSTQKSNATHLESEQYQHITINKADTCLQKNIVSVFLFLS